ncbi:MAG: heme biosynthesis protein HemY [Betaproteobacteria bacterium HGW-Betaproteobacteria-1]|jgi:HemY protein|nr:MAG: heme biosynthesis protein HemY [Betaproteobacteria bacterium HGW-Betaproteobacteria-1]
MRWLLWFLLILLMAIGLSLFASNNEGYVLIVRPPYRLELSFNLLILLIVLSFFSLHLLLRMLNYARGLPASVKEYKERRRQREGRAALVEALHALVDGRYTLAEKGAAKALDLGEDAGLSALVAARAAHKAKRKAQRDFYLAEAERLAPEARTGRLLTQAELLLDDKQYGQALQVLQHLDRLEAKYPPAMRLELKVQLHLGNWEQVLTLLQNLEKEDGLELWKVKQYRQQAHLQMMRRYAGDLKKLQAYWKKLASEEQLNPRIAEAAVQAFITAGDSNQASRVLEMSLTKGWDSDLVGLLGDCESQDPIKQLQQAEYWLTQHEGDANLLLALGRMCMRQRLWGKAESYLEASISVRPSAKAHYMLASLLENRGEQQQAALHYRFSAQLAQSS